MRRRVDDTSYHIMHIRRRRGAYVVLRNNHYMNNSRWLDITSSMNPGWATTLKTPAYCYLATPAGVIWRHSMTSSMHVYAGKPSSYAGVVTWKRFPYYWPLVMGIHRLPVDSPHETVMLTCDVSVLILSKLLNKQSSWWWVKTLWRQCAITVLSLPSVISFQTKPLSANEIGR